MSVIVLSRKFLCLSVQVRPLFLLVIPVFLVLNFILFVPCTSIYVLALLAVLVSERIAVLLVKIKLMIIITERLYVPTGYGPRHPAEFNVVRCRN